jgi:hypothetical protein
MTQQETTTDRLVSIIQLVQLGKRTGILTVKRGEGRVLEEGIVTFVNGQAIQAQVGRYSGSEAMKRLSAWETCRFIFAPSDTPEEDTLPSPKSFKGVGSSIGGQRVTENLSGSADQFPQRPMHSRELITPPPTRDLNYLLHLLSSVPYCRVEMSSALHLLEQMKLTRFHRRLLLLIDGRRSIQELVRLMGRNEKEMQTLLNDLEQALIISIRPVPHSRRPT